MARERIPGLVVGFTLDTCTWVRAFGTADVENGTPTLPNSSFRLASVQKTMTAVAVLQLAERGKLDLDAPIQRYVPHFPRKPWAVTARLLLSHLGGIPHYVNRDVEQRIREHRSTRQAIAIFAAFDLIAEPGTKYSYSSYGYNLLGAAIEGASGLSYAEYMRTHV
jgi:CubicO group peptidase (beta-lactamase class C family)